MQDYISRLTGVSIIGGEGKRLRPFTNNKPKAMLPVGLEKKPMLEFTIKPWIKAGIKGFLFCTGYKNKMIKDYFGDGSNFGIQIDYSKEEKKLKTGGAIKNALDNNKLSKDNPIVVFYCDDLVRLNVENFIRSHLKGVKNHRFKASIVATRKFRTHYGIMKTEQRTKKVTSFKEKPLIDKHANVGIYLLEPDVLGLIDENKPPFKFERVILPELVKRGWLKVHEISWNDWIPVNTDKEYEAVLKTNLSDFYSRLISL